MTPSIPPDFRAMGPLKPMRVEADVDNGVVAEGRVPVDRNGGLYRVGPSCKRPIVRCVHGLNVKDFRGRTSFDELGRQPARLAPQARIATPPAPSVLAASTAKV